MGDAWFNDPEKYYEIINSCKFKYLECMAAWNWVSMVRDRFVGDPVDVAMFKATDWVLDESPDE